MNYIKALVVASIAVLLFALALSFVADTANAFETDYPFTPSYDEHFHRALSVEHPSLCDGGIIGLEIAKRMLWENNPSEYSKDYAYDYLWGCSKVIAAHCGDCLGQTCPKPHPLNYKACDNARHSPNARILNRLEWRWLSYQTPEDEASGEYRIDFHCPNNSSDTSNYRIVLRAFNHSMSFERFSNGLDWIVREANSDDGIKYLQCSPKASTDWTDYTAVSSQRAVEFSLMDFMDHDPRIDGIDWTRMYCSIRSKIALVATFTASAGTSKCTMLQEYHQAAGFGASVPVAGIPSN